MLVGGHTSSKVCERQRHSIPGQETPEIAGYEISPAPFLSWVVNKLPGEGQGIQTTVV